MPLRLLHARAHDVGVESIKVEPDVDAGVLESLHALVMFGRGIDVVDTDRIGSEGLHEVGIKLALVVVNERVFWEKLVGDSCGNVLVECIMSVLRQVKHL